MLAVSFQTIMFGVQCFFLNICFASTTMEKHLHPLLDLLFTEMTFPEFYKQCPHEDPLQMNPTISIKSA